MATVQGTIGLFSENTVIEELDKTACIIFSGLLAPRLNHHQTSCLLFEQTDPRNVPSQPTKALPPAELQGGLHFTGFRGGSREGVVVWQAKWAKGSRG